MNRKRRVRGWALGLLLGVWGVSCEPHEDTGGGGGEGLPSAKNRELRSAFWRDLMASREKAPDPEALKGPDAQGVGGSGHAEPSGILHGRVTWVGDNELLVRDGAGVEQDIEVVPDTRLRLNGNAVGLASMREGDAVKVTYDDGPGGWVAREVDVEVSPPRDISTEREREGRRGRASGEQRGGGSSTPSR
ncbi:hypothetical protein VZQ01_21485 [Myxococcus faecalis]|uniref:hypothetical protein n=1 Tax=Myxococcus faecalis TaxID=3115646 RepID=UPI003CE93674